IAEGERDRCGRRLQVIRLTRLPLRALQDDGAPTAVLGESIERSAPAAETDAEDWYFVFTCKLADVAEMRVARAVVAVGHEHDRLALRRRRRHAADGFERRIVERRSRCGLQSGEE